MFSEMKSGILCALFCLCDQRVISAILSGILGRVDIYLSIKHLLREVKRRDFANETSIFVLKYLHDVRRLKALVSAQLLSAFW